MFMAFINGVANTSKASKSSTSVANVEAPAPIETPAAPVAEVTASSSEESPSAAEAIAPAAESTCPAPTTDVPAADLDENRATAPAVAPVGQSSLEWTAKDDDKLMELRGRKVPWKEIGAILGGKHGIRERFTELSQAKSMHAAGEGQEAKDSTLGDDGVHIDFDTEEGTQSEKASIEGSKTRMIHFEEGDDMTLKEVGSKRAWFEYVEHMELMNVTR